MNEMNGTSADLRADLMIDNAVARRLSGGATREPAATRLSLDEAIVTGLATLGELDWPADEVGDRIAIHVAAASQRAAPVQVPAGTAPLGRRSRGGSRAVRSGWSRWLAAGAGVAAAALIAVAFQLGGPQGAARHSAASGSSRHQSPSATRPVAQTPGAKPESLRAMAIVDSAGAFSAVAGIPNGDGDLTCVTRSVCYMVGYHLHGNPDISRSLDGGATWTAGATLPASPVEWVPTPSCPKPEKCFSAFETGLLVTSDGFAHYRLHRLAMPSGLSAEKVQQVSCPTLQHCVADVVLNNGSQTFIFSGDGGKTWAAAQAPAFSVTEPLGQLRCDPDGACIASLWGGTESHPKGGVLTSADGGRSWIKWPDYQEPYINELTTSCGDARNCLVVGSAGSHHLVWVHVTASGQVRIRIQAFPKRWATGVTVSCATARDCFVETTGSAGTTIEATHNRGLTWRSLGTPLAPALPNYTAAYLSCPVAAGCVAIANNPSQGNNTWAVLSNLHNAG